MHGLPLWRLRETMRASRREDIWLKAVDALDASSRRQLFAGQLRPTDLARLAERNDGSGTYPSAKDRLAMRLREAREGMIDAIVVGAGAAGLAAAAALQEADKRVLVLERNARVGGRACTDVTQFGRAIDVGAEHLHSAAVNPAAALAQRLGFTLAPHAPEPGLAFGGTPGMLPARQALALAASRRRLCLGFEAAASKIPGDVACATLLPCHDPDDIWQESAQAQLYELEMGMGADELSSIDMTSIMPERHGDMYVKEGIGTLIETLRLGLPVATQTRVERIIYGAEGCEVHVDQAVLHAAYVIVTAPIGALQRGEIGFSPPLPEATAEAIDALVMAQYEKAVLCFNDNVFGDVAEGTYMQWRCTPQTAMDFFLQPPMQRDAAATACVAVAYFGGKFATLMNRNPAQAIALAVRRLSGAFGPRVAETLTEAWMSRWETIAGGAYSAAPAGAHHARSALRRPILERLLFAGEACDAPLENGQSWCTQIPGALRSGTAAARWIVKAAK